MKIDFKRKAEGRTNYRKRLILLKSNLPRLVIRKSNKYILAQIIFSKEANDIVKLVVLSKELRAFGWNFSFKNIPAAYLTGLLLAKKAKEKNIVGDLIVDLGQHPSTKGSRLYSLIKGAKAGGLNVRCNEEILPEEKKIFGEKTKQPDKINQKVQEIGEKLK